MSLFLRLIGSANSAEVDASGQQRVILYDSAGNVVTPSNRAAVAETAGGVLNVGKDYKIARTLRASSIGTLRTSDDSLFLYDSYEGTARDSNKWIEALASFTTAQALATGLTLNNGASTTTAQGALESSHRQFPIIPRCGLIFRTRLRNTGASNQVCEFGFGDTSSATTAVVNNGAFFRKDGAGSLQGVLSMNGAEVQSTVMTAPATTDYAIYEVYLEDSRVTFQIMSSAGALISAVTMEVGATVARLFAVTHLPCFHRIWNNGTAGAGGQLIINQTVVVLVDSLSQRDYQVGQSGMSYSSLTSPTAYTQLANWSNSAAPTTRTLSNTAAAETTLGGLLVANSIAGGNTDLIMFGWQNPSPYTFHITGIFIPPPLNQVVAVATTATIFAYFLALNSSAVSLATAAPYAPMRIALPGVHTAAVALAANNLFSGPQIQMFDTPIGSVQPGRFLHIGCRELVGTATATETYLWAGVGVTGFFE